MITFKQYITEIFDGQAIQKWKVINQNNPLLASFEFKQHQYLIAINSRSEYDNTRLYYISFGLNNVSASETGKLLSKYSLKEAIVVYNTVIDVIRTKISPYLREGDEIKFESYDPRTVNLYTRFAKMIVKEVGGKYERNGTTFRIKV